MPGFVAFRAMSGRGCALEAAHAPHSNVSHPNNAAVSSLRLAKITSLPRALRRYERALFLDTDTVVCADARALLARADAAARTSRSCPCPRAAATATARCARSARRAEGRARGEHGRALPAQHERRARASARGRTRIGVCA